MGANGSCVETYLPTPIETDEFGLLIDGNYKKWKPQTNNADKNYIVC